MTRMGITRKLVTVQASPSRPATICPSLSERSSIMRRMSPTVAEIRAQPAMRGRREKATFRPYDTVGSPPSMRMVAQATIAELKKTITR